MIPIVIDPNVAHIALIGRGDATVRRLALFDEGGTARLTVYSDEPTLDLKEAAGDRLIKALPSPTNLAAFAVVWIVDLPLALAQPLAEQVRAHGALVNVEDVKPYCDFHNPALVRRGDLLLTVSTNGQSPGLAARIKKQLGTLFGPEWADRLHKISRKRNAWKRRERPLPELARLTDATIDAKGWLQAVPGRLT
ncbi:MAG: precorrin-2 dehydrogenase/sirohydrochlorin ferrochelatase family protein [Geminicoccales bacterium]